MVAAGDAPEDVASAEGAVSGAAAAAERGNGGEKIALLLSRRDPGP